MSVLDSLTAKGQLTLTLMDPSGAIKDVRHVRNLVVGAGLDHISSRMIGTAQAVMSHMALGAGTTAAASGDTALGSQLGSRKVFDSVTRTGANNQSIVYVTTFGAGEATGAVTEAGVFNASSGGVMLCRTVFAVLNKAAGDTVQVTWTVTISP